MNISIINIIDKINARECGRLNDNIGIILFVVSSYIIFFELFHFNNALHLPFLKL